MALQNSSIVKQGHTSSGAFFAQEENNIETNETIVMPATIEPKQWLQQWKLILCQTSLA